jgi:hypothetical protein
MTKIKESLEWLEYHFLLKNKKKTLAPDQKNVKKKAGYFPIQNTLKNRFEFFALFLPA